MWSFLSRGYGETEGYSNGSLAEFKGNPLQALAREICQNSLDAADGSGNPVVVEFQPQFIDIESFPGMASMRDVIDACQRFWYEKGDVNTITFLNNAKDCLKQKKFSVLRVSDYNTTGVRGAFSKEDITPWGSLVKGNSFSVKADEKNAAGSYGIGKAAPFVSSYFQTVFYRTMDSEGVQAALGVARLMAHESIVTLEGEDPVRRSVGYYGADEKGRPASGFPELDVLNKRDRCGTDLFIPGFTTPTSDGQWIKEILKEIVDNFLYSIYNRKLEIRIEGRTLNRNSLGAMLDYIGSKDAKMFYDVIRQNDQVSELMYPFHNLGVLRLRLLYGNDLNKKVLVVRSSGMKIAKISSLPRTMSYTGFLELQGDNLNEFFRAMENPSHNAWEPRRHGNPRRAKQYKDEVENWVIEKITEKLLELSGDESEIDIGDCFNSSDVRDSQADTQKIERISNETEKVDVESFIPVLPKEGRISIRDEGRAANTRKAPGREDKNGTAKGHRHRTGKKSGGRPDGRQVTPDPDGLDSVDSGEGGKRHEVYIQARVISHGDGKHRLIFTAAEDITLGLVEVVTKGENGRSLKLQVLEADSEIAYADSGYIVIHDVPANVKQTINIKLRDANEYALGVRAYGN